MTISSRSINPCVDTAALREKLSEAVTKILDVLDHLDGDSDFEPEPLELADDSEESAEPIRDPLIYIIALERALRKEVP